MRFTVLGDAGVNIEMISTSPIKISCVVREEDVETAVRALHTAFDLGGTSVRPEDVAGVHRPKVREEARPEGRRGGRHRRRGLHDARRHAGARLPRRRGRALRLRALGRAARSTSASATSRWWRCRDEAIQGFDLALFSAGSAISEEWGRASPTPGAVVVDNSSFWRMHDDVPLVVAEVNPDALDGHRGIVANPNCTTMQTVVALKPILDAAGIERVVASTYQAVSGTGQRAVEELHDQARATLEAKDIPPPSVYPHQIAFNVVPQVEHFMDGDDYTTEERKVMRETRKILGRDDLGDLGHLRARARVHRPLGVRERADPRAAVGGATAASCWPRRPGVTVVDDPANGLYPLALDAAGRDDVLVGRIRHDPSHERCLNLWIVGDNLRKGAATNAVQLAELLRVREPAAAPRRAA